VKTSNLNKYTLFQFHELQLLYPVLLAAISVFLGGLLTLHNQVVSRIGIIHITDLFCAGPEGTSERTKE
jgi:hypothetical protein